MNKNRLEAFSDGVLAIILTIMVLELKVPEKPDFASLFSIFPVFISYVLSFIYIGIYWNNHHHMLNSTEKIDGKILWANSHLLFWLSLVPFATGWMGETGFAQAPIAVYGFVLLMAGVAYVLLQNLIIKKQGENSLLKKAVGKDLKGKLSSVLYITAIACSFFEERISGIIYIFVALMWLVPDKRIERIMEDNEQQDSLL